jgi:hypothetical protein
MMFPGLVAELQQRGITVPLSADFEGCVRHVRVCFEKLHT